MRLLKSCAVLRRRRIFILPQRKEVSLLAKPEKVAAVAEIKERIENSEVAIMSTYIGINVAKVTNLRRKMRENGIEYKVYKNTLSTIALQELGLEKAAPLMTGPTAWAFSKDPVAPAKILKECGKESEFVKMVGGVLSGQVVNAGKLEQLADLPSREQLIAQVVGTIAMPLRNLAGALNALPRNLANVVDQIREQKEKAA
ncbi:MAG: 50S ribosomal protein L10 [Candidatus Hydrogenedentes bacterium]|nr:50S ribosomal protein L10 [Candidatus Hydrogenedentota bacterium]